jgi:hypothetical protein
VMANLNRQTLHRIALGGTVAAVLSPLIHQIEARRLQFRRSGSAAR